MSDHYSEQREKEQQQPLDVREEALNWLVENIQHWPQRQHLPESGISDRYFRNFHFAVALEEGEPVVFVNGLVPGITEEEWKQACPTGEDFAATAALVFGEAAGGVIAELLEALAEGECPKSAECDDPGCPYHYASDGQPVDGNPGGVKPIQVSEITEFVPNKYHRKIRVAPNQVSILADGETGEGLAVDVWIDGYDLMDAYGGSSAVDHAMKKLIALGQRGSKSYAQDLDEVIQSLQREQQRIYLAEV